MQYSGVQEFKTVLQYSLLGSSVLQYTALYCGWKGCWRLGCIAIQHGVSWHETGLPVSQDRHPCRDTAGWVLVRAGVGAGERRAAGAREWAWARTAGASESARTAGERQLGASVRARQGVAGAQPGRWARGLATGCALGALGLFSIRFDLVLFLSRFLDIVREPGLSTLFISKFFRKKYFKFNLK